MLLESCTVLSTERNGKAMEHSRMMEYKVGIFVAIATVITLGFVLVLGGNKGFFNKTALLHLKTTDTEGLGVGATVQLSGVPCGNVLRIEFDSKSNNIDVVMKVDYGSLARMTEGTQAGIRTQGALGDKYVSLRPGPYSEKHLNDGDTLTPEAGTDFMSTIGKAGTRVERAFEIIDEVHTLVKGLNDRNIGQNLSDTAKYARGVTESLNQIISSLKTQEPGGNKLKVALDHLASIFSKIDNGQGTIGGLINDPTVHEDLKDIMGGAKRSKVLKFLIRQAVQKNEDEEKKDRERENRK